MKGSNQNTFFSVSIEGEVASIKFNDCPILHGTNLIAKDRFISQFERMSENNKIKVIILSFSSDVNPCGFRMLEKKPDSINEKIFIKRIHNSIDQYRMLIMNCNKITYENNKQLDLIKSSSYITKSCHT